MSVYDKASLVLIPSGTKTSKVYSQKPVNGDGDFTFSRSTAATRVNADGNIEKETQNFLTHSNTFDVSWSNGGTLTSGQSGYDGTNDAWLFATTAGAQYIAKGQSVSGVQTFSLYAKAGTTDGVALRIIGGSNPYFYYNLNNGSVVGGGGSSSKIATDITSVGNGWYRCSLSIADSSSSVRIYCATSSGDFAAGNIYIQDAQLEQGLVARDYIETTTAAVEGGITDNVPRLDYTDSSCPALLLEPSRTNLVKQSEYYSGSDWISSNVTITDNVTTSPEGLQNASLINFTSSGNYFQHQGPAIVSGVTYTISCYVKRAISTDQVFKIYGNNNKASANLTATSEWQRFSHTFTADTTNFASGLNAPSTAQIYVYGFQVEQGSYPTSYIPTYGTSVTRNVDVGYNSSAASVIGQGEGTIYIETIPLDDTTSYTERLIQFESSGSDFMTLQRYANSNITFYGTDGTNTWTIQGTNVFTGGEVTKIAAAYKVDDVALYANGTQLSTDTSVATMPNCDRVWFANNASGSSLYIGKHTKVMFFPTRLSNEELAALTTI